MFDPGPVTATVDRRRLIEVLDVVADARAVRADEKTMAVSSRPRNHLPVSHAAPSVHKTTGAESNVSPTGGGGPQVVP